MPGVESATPWGAIGQGVGAVAGLAQTLIESGKAKRANKKLDSLFAQRKAFKTPKEIFDIVNLTTSNTQGYSDQTMNYLTGQAGAGASSALGVAERLGADPNQLGGILDKYYQDIFAVGQGSEMQKLRQFDKLTEAITLLGQNKDAEWASQENLLKDRMKAVAAQLGRAEIGVNSGLNLALTGLTGLASSNIYGRKDTTTTTPPTTTPATTPATPPAVGSTWGGYSFGTTPVRSGVEDLFGG